ncbi:hypothetical protein TRVL_02715 [Trypanosoma vivax]|nr:hypothetical protein TRVL_02715 [Trypanosoma vivax]
MPNLRATELRIATVTAQQTRSAPRGPSATRIKRLVEKREMPYNVGAEATLVCAMSSGAKKNRTRRHRPFYDNPRFDVNSSLPSFFHAQSLSLASCIQVGPILLQTKPLIRSMVLRPPASPPAVLHSNCTTAHSLTQPSGPRVLAGSRSL